MRRRSLVIATMTVILAMNLIVELEEDWNAPANTGNCDQALTSLEAAVLEFETVVKKQDILALPTQFTGQYMPAKLEVVGCTTVATKLIGE